MGKLYLELKKRKVLTVAGIYIVSAWVIIQVADTTAPLMNLSQTVPQLILYLLILLFPIALLLAWFFQITPAGVKLQISSNEELEKYLSMGQTVGLGVSIVVVAFVSAVAINPLLREGQSLSNLDILETTDSLSPVIQEVVIPIAENSIAVLAFDDMSPDGDQEYMSDGIAEELLNLLARIPTLRVTARTSAFSFKNSALTIPEIAQQLNVAYILEGSVRTADDQIRITAQLIDARDDVHIWSESFTRELDDVFAIQDEIAAEVIGQLELTLASVLPHISQIDSEAYTLFLQARHLAIQSSPEALIEADQLFQQVLAIEPGYAPALVELAVIRSSIGTTDSATISLVEEALVNDPNYAPAHAWLGLQAIAESEMNSALRYISRAISLDSKNSDILAAAASLYNSLGHLDKAIEASEYANQSDPVNFANLSGLAVLYWHAGRTDESIATIENLLSRSPRFQGARFIMALNLIDKGEYQSALEQLQLENDELFRRFGNILVYHALGDRETSDMYLSELIALLDGAVPYFPAWAYAMRDENDLAFEYLYRAIEVNDSFLQGLLTNRGFRSLYDDPRWMELRDRIGRSPEDLESITLNIEFPD